MDASDQPPAAMDFQLYEQIEVLGIAEEQFPDSYYGGTVARMSKQRGASEGSAEREYTIVYEEVRHGHTTNIRITCSRVGAGKPTACVPAPLPLVTPSLPAAAVRERGWQPPR